MTGHTTKPRPPAAHARVAGVPVVDLVYDHRRISIVIRGETLVLGRAGTCDCVVENDGLSREHAKFVSARDGLVHLVDLESTNGTFVNGERITVARLRARDALMLGPDVHGVFRYVASAEEPHGMLGRLTDRQLHVACLVAEGLTSAEIGAELGLSARTVESHLARIFRRVQARGRAALARLVTEAGLPQLPRGSS